MLNRRDADIDYAYSLPNHSDSRAGIHSVFHPTEPFLVRFTLRYSFGR